MGRRALESLAAFCGRLSDPNFEIGKWISQSSAETELTHMPYVHYSEVSQQFIMAAYDNQWLDSDLDWSEWVSSPEAMCLIADPRALASADAKNLSQLLTVCIRRDKFSEGSLFNDFESGLILRIVQRAATLVEMAQETGATLKKLSSQQAGVLGELLALAKLNSLGLAAYMSPEGAPGHDLIAIVEGKAITIEVKTRQFLRKPTEISRWPVNLATKGDADFFLFVELNLNSISPTFYLLTNKQACETNKVSNGLGNCNPWRVRLIPLIHEKKQVIAQDSDLT